MFHATTIIAVKKGERVAIAGDGQVTISGNIAIKHQARKVRKLYNNTVIGGFAGSVADALTLFEKFEKQLKAIMETCVGPLWNWQRNGERIVI